MVAEYSYSKTTRKSTREYTRLVSTLVISKRDKVLFTFTTVRLLPVAAMFIDVSTEIQRVHSAMVE